ncbi:hypothetical protein ACQPXB_32720 [Amycolatopsis sp. CA-161197]|uniref:hypothetical protein n=1 Tax=Amycolatopsis sp. CA-161197 TaxID=3239922 RepID=UPI003D8DBCB7
MLFAHPQIPLVGVSFPGDLVAPVGEDVLVPFGFTADRYALVLSEGLGRLVKAFSAARKLETFEGVKSPRTTAGPTGIRGPFTPAPPGMIVVFSDGTTREPVRYFDVLGRPVLIDLDSKSRALYLAQEDEGIVRIEGPEGSSVG